VVLRQHDAKDERGGDSPPIRLAYRDIGETPCSGLVQLAGPQQVAHEALTIGEKLRRSQRDIHRRAQPGGARSRVDILMLENRRHYWRLAYENRMNTRQSEDHRDERSNGQEQ